MSWHPASEAMAVNVFSLTWNNNYFYMFPSFSLVGRVLAKVNRDKTKAITVVPYCSMQIANADVQPRATIFSTISKKSDSYTQTLREPTTTSKTSVNDNQGNTTTVKILEASLRQSAHCRYNNYIKHWLDYLKTMRKIEVTHVLDFLSAIFEHGTILRTGITCK